MLPEFLFPEIGYLSVVAVSDSSVIVFDVPE
jgi:hypothetical protein